MFYMKKNSHVHFFRQVWCSVKRKSIGATLPFMLVNKASTSIKCVTWKQIFLMASGILETKTDDSESNFIYPSDSSSDNESQSE